MIKGIIYKNYGPFEFRKMFFCLLKIFFRTYLKNLFSTSTFDGRSMTRDFVKNLFKRGKEGHYVNNSYQTILMVLAFLSLCWSLSTIQQQHESGLIKVLDKILSGKNIGLTNLTKVLLSDENFVQ